MANSITFGYVRVSSNDQNEARQIEKMRELGIDERHIFIDKKSGKDFIIRTPLIPGITDTDENLGAIREIVKDSPWQTLPYNPLTPSKYERLGKKYSLL